MQGPRFVESGQALQIRVRLAPLKAPGYVTADLHWARTHDHSQGYLSTGGARQAGVNGGAWDYVIQVPPRPGLRFVRAVIYLSRTGDWNTHSLVAGSEVIEVLTNSPSDSQAQVLPLRMTNERPPPEPYGAISAAPRFLTGLLFLVAAALSWRRFQSEPGDEESNGSGARLWLTAAASFTVAAIWELAGVESRVDSLVRKLAHQEDWYYLRGVVQKVAISFIAALVLLVLARVFRAKGPRRLAAVFFLSYVALSAINLVSLHSIDQIANYAWHGVSLIQGLKLGCAVALSLLLFAARDARA